MSSRSDVPAPVPAYLPGCLLDRLQATLGGGAVLPCASTDALVTVTAAANPRAVVIDPVLCGQADTLTCTLSESLGRRVPVVLYTHPSPTSIRLCFGWARAGALHLVLAGVDDDATRLHAIFDALVGTPHVEALVARLDEHLALVPTSLASAVRGLFMEQGAVPPLDALAASSFMTRRSVDRWLRRAGLAPPKRFLGAARLVRTYDALAAGETSISRAARRAGFHSERSLVLHARALLDAAPSVLRTLQTEELHERIARRLCEV
jgi:AraC-like DNA-binding protein